MRGRIVGTVSFLILAILLPGVAGGAAPSNYDECILESMKSVKSDLAAKSIIMSCRKKFEKPNKKFSDLQGHRREPKLFYRDWMAEARSLEPRPYRCRTDSLL